MLDCLKVYLTMGWPLLPCSSRTKAPLTTHGYLDASTDMAQVEAWYQQYPGCAWGVRTSAERAVIDVDPRHGGDRHWHDLISQHGPLPPTPKVLTGGRGHHFWLCFPPGTKGRRIAKSDHADADSITLKAEGGFVIVPPSRINIPEHEGRAYAWETRPWEMRIAEAPDWLLTTNPKLTAAQKAENNPWIVQAATPDLLTHPGADKSKGDKRRPLLVKMIGVHLARGDSPASIMAMAEAWANRCQPPLEREEWEPHVVGLCAKEEAKAGPMTRPASPAPDSFAVSSPLEAGEEGSISEPDGPAHLLPSSSEPDAAADASVGAGSDQAVSTILPTLQPTAYHGLLGEMLRAITPETEADPAGILLGWLTCFGNVVGRGAWVQVGADAHYPALFVSIVGKTSDAKGIAWGVSKWPFVQADPLWARTCICNGVGSGQGLIERVRDERRTQKLGKDGTVKEQVIPAAQDNRCLLRLDELAVCFKLQRSENSTLGETLLTAWGGEPLEVPNRGDNALSASGYTISVVGDTQPGALRKLVEKGMEQDNGWLNRFLWCAVRSARDLPQGGNINVLQPFLGRLHEALAFGQKAGPLQRDAEAEALWESVYAELKRSGDSVPHTDRGRPYVVRLSMLYALADRSTVIRQEHVRAALAVWEYCRQSARRIFGGQQGPEPGAEPFWLQVLNGISKSPGISRSDLLRAFRSVSAEELEKVLADLEAQGLAHRRMVGTGGRKAERWFPGPNPDGDGEGGGTADTRSQPSPDGGSAGKEGSKPPADGERRTLPSFPPRADASAEILPSLPATTESVGRGVCRVIQPAVAPTQVQNQNPTPYADAEAWVRAVYQAGGRIEKEDGGECVVYVPENLDPKLNLVLRVGYTLFGEEAFGQFLSSEQWSAEFLAMRPDD